MASSKQNTIENKLKNTDHKDRVDALTAYTVFVMRDICKLDDVPESILIISARKIVENWLRSEYKEAKDVEEDDSYEGED